MLFGIVVQSLPSAVRACMHVYIKACCSGFQNATQLQQSRLAPALHPPNHLLSGLPNSPHTPPNHHDRLHHPDVPRYAGRLRRVQGLAPFLHPLDRIVIILVSLERQRLLKPLLVEDVQRHAEESVALAGRHPREREQSGRRVLLIAPLSHRHLPSSISHRHPSYPFVRHSRHHTPPAALCHAYPGDSPRCHGLARTATKLSLLRTRRARRRSPTGAH